MIRGNLKLYGKLINNFNPNMKMKIKINHNDNEKFSFLYIMTAFNGVLKKYDLSEVKELMRVYYDLAEDVVFKIDDINLLDRIKKDLFGMGIKFYLNDGEVETFISPAKSRLWDTIEEYKRNKNSDNITN